MPPALSIKEVSSGDQLVHYSSNLHAYLPRLPFYMCATCFETIVPGEIPRGPLVGSVVATHRCSHHPSAPILFSSTNPNLGRIPWPTVSSSDSNNSSDDDW